MNPNELISTSNYVNKTILNNVNNNFILQTAAATSNYLFPRMPGNKLSPIKPVVAPNQSTTSAQTNAETHKQSSNVYERKKLRKRSLSQTTSRVQEKHVESKFVSNSMQSFRTILEEKEEELRRANLNQVNESLNEIHLTSSTENILQTKSQHQISLVLPEISQSESGN